MKITAAISGSRPRLKIPRAPLEQGLTLLSAAGLIGQAAYLALAYGALPDRVPMHAGFSGTVDSWGPKSTLLALPLVSLAMFIGLELTKLIPHYYNYPWPITAENAPRLYRISRELIGWVEFEVILLFGYIMFAFIQASAGGTGLGPFLMVISIAVILGTTVVYTLLLYKNK